jgi:FkbM family methyltransferase
MVAILPGLRSACGIARSLRVYYGNRRHARAMDRLYSQFVHSGDLVFDVGAHVGNRIASFRRLGARVVAVEPQPALVKILKLLYGRTPTVTIEAAAIGNRVGVAKLMINIDNPTTSTTSAAFIDAARSAAGWEAQHWPRCVNVAMTTLDAMMVRYGAPAFIKIDVEGFEAEVLAGLSRRVSALSFEFTTNQRDVAAACITRCVELGYTRFNAALGESQSLVHASWLDASAIARWLAALPHAANSGDVYAAAG